MALKRKKEEGSCSSADSANSIKPKPKRKQISASTSERPNMHWEADWNMPFLDLLDDICKGRERSIGRAFDNAFWRAFAPLFCTKINRSGITAEDCKERTKFFEAKFRDYKGDTPTAEDRKIASVYRRDPVPKVPRAPADFGATGEASSSRSRSRARSRPRSTASCGPSPEDQRRIALHAAVSELVRHHGLRWDILVDVVQEFDTPVVASVFLDHTRAEQMNLIIEKFGAAAQIANAH